MVRRFEAPAAAATAPSPTTTSTCGRTTPAPRGCTACIRSYIFHERLPQHRRADLIQRRYRPRRPHRRGRRHPGGRAGPSGASTLTSLMLQQRPSARVLRDCCTPTPSRTRERRRDPPRDRRALVRGALVRKYKKQHILYFCFCLLGNPEI
jgi:hypothetical protein